MEVIALHRLGQIERFPDMPAMDALNVTFELSRMNFSCYGNAEPHVHWRIVPRYEDDPHPGIDPWRDIERFSERRISADEGREIAARIRRNLATN